jgi:uncharacterized RDD family membrane protein YckC
MEDLLSDVYTEPQLASIGSRVGAALIDLATLGIVFAGFASVWGERTVDGGVQVDGLPALAMFAIDFLLIPVQEGIDGKTIGKRIMGIQVRRKDFNEAGVGLSIARHLFDIIDMMFWVGIIIASSDPYRQRIGDRVARTVVIKTPSQRTVKS